MGQSPNCLHLKLVADKVFSAKPQGFKKFGKQRLRDL